jgi:hypothetical protein
METAALAECCARLQVPLACLRVITDACDVRLSPQLTGMLQGERVSPLRLLVALLRRPALLGELGRLARDSRVAARNLAWGLERLLAD